MRATWAGVHSMERFVEFADTLGIERAQLELAKLAVDLARQAPPVDVESSLELWHRICAHCCLHPSGRDGFAFYLAALAWREGHSQLLEHDERRRWRWRRRQPTYEVSTIAW